MAELYLKKMALEDHQAIGFLHSDKNHIHAHLIINRINENDFSLYNDSFVGKRSSKAADEIAVEMGLTRAREIERENKLAEANMNGLNKSKPSGSRQHFKADMEKLLQKGQKDLTAYFKALEELGYTVKQHINKETGELRGYGLFKDEIYLDASTIDKKLTIKNLSFGVVKKQAIENKNKPTEVLQPDREERRSMGRKM